MRKILVILFFLLIACILQGCGTIFSHKILNSEDKCQESDKYEDDDFQYKSYIYSGTVFDAYMFSAPFACMLGIVGGEGCWGVMGIAPVFIIGGAVDLPLSLTADTLLLPYTISKEMSSVDSARCNKQE